MEKHNLLEVGSHQTLIGYVPFLHDLSPSVSALTRSHNKQVSGFAHPNFALRETSHIPGTLCETAI